MSSREVERILEKLEEGKYDQNTLHELSISESRVAFLRFSLCIDLWFTPSAVALTLKIDHTPNEAEASENDSELTLFLFYFPKISFFPCYRN